MEFLKSSLCVLIVLFLLCGLFVTIAVAKIDPNAKHSGIVSPETTSKNYEIAVAYDNSGSMYNGYGSWYQAKYAMEIFASMIDFNNGDKLTVFPMHPVTIDGNKESKEVTDLTITSVSDIDKIHNMYTPSAGGTPFDTVVAAYNHLISAKQSNSSLECWLIVLTDGSFDQGNCQSELMQMSQNVNVQYIPFGSGSSKYDDNSNTDNFYACDKITGEKELQTQMISICNRIFQRDILDGYLNDKTLTLELSMKKVIVFVQGNGATIASLKSDSGVEIKKLIDSGHRKYSDLGAGGGPELPKSLENQTGQVVTFDACAKGKYTLEYSNASDIQIFYEPDVAMVIDFIDQDGNVEDFSDGEVKEGEYTFNVKIVDAQTGEDVSDHKLLGGNVKIDSKIKYPDGKELDIKDGDKVTFTPGEDVEFDISATYLDRYHLRSLDAIDIDWSKIQIISCFESLELEATVEQDHSWYRLSENNNWEPIRLDLTIDGAPLTDEQLDNATVSLQFKNDKQTLPYQLEILHGQSAINIHIGRDDAGNYVEPKTDTYKPTITVSTIDKYGNTISADDDVKFDVSEDSYYWGTMKKWVFVGSIIALILFLLWLLLSIPVMPARITIVSQLDNGSNDEPPHIQTLYLGSQETEKSMTMNGFDTDNTPTIFTAKITKPDKYFGIKNNTWLKRCFNYGYMDVNIIIGELNQHDTVRDLSVKKDDTISTGETITWSEKLYMHKHFTGINAQIEIHNK